MIINLILAIVLTVIAISLMATFGQITSVGADLIKAITRAARHSKILLGYLGRAYQRYRKNIHRDLILNA